jgi:CubicO group peptidase (beta-lactamase class C family)
MKTSSSELTKWMLAQMNFGTLNGVRILSEENSRLMQTLVEPRSGTGIYGLGFMLRDDFVEGTTLIGHTGNAYGLLSAMFFCQNRDFGVALLTNGSRPKEGGDNRILEDIVSAMYQVFN